jgi:hypothetical protein
MTGPIQTQAKASQLEEPSCHSSDTGKHKQKPLSIIHKQLPGSFCRGPSEACEISEKIYHDAFDARLTSHFQFYLLGDEGSYGEG